LRPPPFFEIVKSHKFHPPKDPESIGIQPFIYTRKAALPSSKTSGLPTTHRIIGTDPILFGTRIGTAYLIPADVCGPKLHSVICDSYLAVYSMHRNLKIFSPPIHSAGFLSNQHVRAFYPTA